MRTLRVKGEQAFLGAPTSTAADYVKLAKCWNADKSRHTNLIDPRSTSMEISKMPRRHINQLLAVGGCMKDRVGVKLVVDITRHDHSPDADGARFSQTRHMLEYLLDSFFKFSRCRN